MTLIFPNKDYWIYVILLAVLIFFLIPAEGCNHKNQGGKIFLTKVKSYKANFIEKSFSKDGRLEYEHKGKWFFLNPNKIRREFITNTNSTVINVDDGKYTWSYDTNSNSKLIFKMQHNEYFSKYFDEKGFKEIETKKVNGYDVKVYEFKASDEILKKAPDTDPVKIMYITVGSQIVTNYHSYDKKGELTHSLELSNIEENVSLDDELFMFKAPADAQIVDLNKEKGADPLLPSCSLTI